MNEFQFKDIAPLTDGEIELVLREKIPENKKINRVPAYEFAVCLPESHTSIGRISLRIGNTEDVVMYAGHIGYGIDKEYRGHHYAARACRLIIPVALDYGFKTLWITCNPDNYPSRRTCEMLGCELVEIVDLPEDNDQYMEGERQKCRYRWDIGGLVKA